ncbi:MAG TPA: glycoside hydrolase 100 family protein [Chitinophagaceae bacterium]
MKESYAKAVELLIRAGTPKGFVAAVQEEDNYKRVWTRDSALCGLAALSTGKESLIRTYKASIETILQHQHPAGFIPSNVTEGDAVSYGGVVGRVDNHAWIIISACNYAHVTGEREWLSRFENKISKSFELMRAWEFNGRGLMYSPQSADWADEYHHHGYILYNQLLRLWALRSASILLENEHYAQEAVRIQIAIEDYFSGDKYYSVQTERSLKGSEYPYWLMGFNPSAVYGQFDLQANALALLLNIGTPNKQKSLLTFIKDLCKATALQLPSFYPAITDNDPEYKELQKNYAYRFRNLPFEFHNGGLWPVWNGFAAFVLSKYAPDITETLSERISIACSQNNWEFNECFHGQSNKAVGVPNCSWSAAGMILSTNTTFIHSLIT